VNRSLTLTASPFFGLLEVVTSGNVERKETYFLHRDAGKRDEIVRIWSGRREFKVRSSTIGGGTRGGQFGGFSSGCCFNVVDVLVKDEGTSFVFVLDLGGMVESLVLYLARGELINDSGAYGDSRDWRSGSTCSAVVMSRIDEI